MSRLLRSVNEDKSNINTEDPTTHGSCHPLPGITISTVKCLQLRHIRLVIIKTVLGEEHVEEISATGL